MGKIKIPVKKAGVYNKDQTLPEIPETETTSTTSTALSLTPFIDKIVITIVPPTAEVGQSIHDAFFTYAEDKTLFLDARRIRTFTIGKRIVLSGGFGTTANPHLMIAHGHGKVTRLRLEFSPADLGLEGMHLLHSALVTFLPDGWDFVVENGLVRKIEVSVDLPNIPTSSLYPLLKQTTSAQTWSNDGLLQTLVLGKSKSGAQTRIYDRGAKRKAKGQLSPEYEGTRVERIVMLARPLSKLMALPNQFSHIQFTIAPPTPPSEPKPYIWAMFMDSVAARSLTVALKLLPPEKRATYRKWFNQHKVDWWDTDAIWKRWPDYLTSSGLLKKPAKPSVPKG